MKATLCAISLLMNVRRETDYPASQRWSGTWAGEHQQEPRRVRGDDLGRRSPCRFPHIEIFGDDFEILGDCEPGERLTLRFEP
jgi:hypothetical protein